MTFYNDNEEENELHIAWPNYSPEKQQQQSSLLPLVLMINEKLRERLPAWEIISLNSQHFPEFFEKILKMICDENLGYSVQIHLITFFELLF